MMAYLPSVILVLLAVTSVWVSSLMFGHPISPFSIFYGVWFFTLALFFLRLVEYTPVRAQAWRLIVLNLVSFGFGSMLALLFQRPGIKKRRIEFAIQGIATERLRRVICLSFALGMAGLAEFLWRVQGVLGLVTYIEAPHEIRQAMAMGGILEEGFKPLNWLNVMSVVLCAYYLRFKQNGQRRLVWMILVASIVATLFMEDRTRFFFALLWTTYVLAQMGKWNARKLLAAGLALVAVLGVQFFAVAAWLGKVAVNNGLLMEAANVSEPFLPLLAPYIYVTGSYPALQAYLDTRPESTAGAMTFYPAFKSLRLVNPSLKVPQIIAEPVAIPSEINTFTWLHQFYTDFGVAGVILGPLTVAFLSGLIFFRMLGTKSFYGLYANGLISFALTMSFMVNHITQGPLWYLLAVGFPIARYIARPTHALAQR